MGLAMPLDFSCPETFLVLQKAQVSSVLQAESSAIVQLSAIPGALEPDLWEWTSHHPTKC